METSNTEVNKVYEALVPKELTKPTAASDRPEKEEWIRAKYVDLAFTPKEEKMALLVCGTRPNPACQHGVCYCSSEQ